MKFSQLVTTEFKWKLKKCFLKAELHCAWLPVFKAAAKASKHASATAPSKSMHTISANIHHTNLSLSKQRSFKSTHFELSIISAIIFVVTCAKSLGGPGLNFCEHKGGSSTFGIKNPLSGNSGFGWHNSWLKNYKVNENFLHVYI